jgi:hypothetical protein
LFVSSHLAHDSVGKKILTINIMVKKFTTIDLRGERMKKEKCGRSI